MGNLQVAANSIRRGLILKTINESAPLGASIEVVKSVLLQHGHKLDRAETLKQCQYLEGKGLVRIDTTSNEVLNIRREIAHITPKGIDVLEGTEIINGIELGG